MSLGEYHSCGILTDGKMKCWGAFFHGQTMIPADSVDSTWLAVSSGKKYSCGVRSDHSVRCWGKMSDSTTAMYGTPSPDLKIFKTLSCGDTHCCALTLEGKPYCWDYGGCWPDFSVPKGSCTGPATVVGADRSKKYTKLAAGYSFLCGIECDVDADPTCDDPSTGGAGNTVNCGHGTGRTSAYYTSVSNPLTTWSGKYLGFSASDTFICGIKKEASGNHPICMGNTYGIAIPNPDDDVIDVCAGNDHTCTVDKSGVAHCQGAGQTASGTPTAALFVGADISTRFSSK